MNDNRCPACCGAPAKPYRHYVDGKIREGCIHDFHTGHLVTPSASQDWHNRKEARDWRRKHKR